MPVGGPPPGMMGPPAGMMGKFFLRFYIIRFLWDIVMFPCSFLIYLMCSHISDDPNTWCTISFFAKFIFQCLHHIFICLMFLISIILIYLKEILFYFIFLFYQIQLGNTIVQYTSDINLRFFDHDKIYGNGPM